MLADGRGRLVLTDQGDPRTGKQSRRLGEVRVYLPFRRQNDRERWMKRGGYVGDCRGGSAMKTQLSSSPVAVRRHGIRSRASFVQACG